MSFKLQQMIQKLEQGHEFCGICGKDITDQPDCMHSRFPLSSSGKGGKLGRKQAATREGEMLVYEDTLYSSRIGMEMLLYPEELLESSAVFDDINVFKYDWVQCYDEFKRLSDLNDAGLIDLRQTNDRVNYYSPKRGKKMVTS